MKIFSGTYYKTGFWFRVLGYGLSVSTDPPLFSERNGLKKVVRVFGVKIELLAPPAPKGTINGMAGQCDNSQWSHLKEMAPITGSTAMAEGKGYCGLAGKMNRTGGV